LTRDLPVEQADTETLSEKTLKILQETVVNKVSCGLESIVDIIVGLGVVDANTQSILDFSHVEEIGEVLGRSRVILRVSDIIGTTAGVAVVRTFDIVSAHILCFGAYCLGGEVVLTSLSGLAAAIDQIETSAAHVQGELHIVVDSIVDSLDTVCVVDGKLRVVRSLDSLVNDTVSDTKSIEVKLHTRNSSIGDELVLVVEVVEERRSCNYARSATDSKSGIAQHKP
jgi:hypothetical protein